MHVRARFSFEAVIESALQTLIEVGQALLEIRDRRLYLEQGFVTCEGYCRKRWNMSRASQHCHEPLKIRVRAAGSHSTAGRDLP